MQYKKIYMIGTLCDTKSLKNRIGYQMLFIDDWDIEKNDYFINEIIETRSLVYLCSIFKLNTTVYAREIRQLLNAGYIIKNRYMHPTSYIPMIYNQPLKQKKVKKKKETQIQKKIE